MTSWILLFQTVMILGLVCVGLMVIKIIRTILTILNIHGVLLKKLANQNDN